MMTMEIQDPEAYFYAARHLAKLGEVDRAINWFQRSVAGGYFCYPAMAADPWLRAAKKGSGFAKVMKQAENQHRRAAAVFSKLHGERMLGLAE